MAKYSFKSYEEVVSGIQSNSSSNKTNKYGLKSYEESRKSATSQPISSPQLTNTYTQQANAEENARKAEQYRKGAQAALDNIDELKTMRNTGDIEKDRRTNEFIKNYEKQYEHMAAEYEKLTGQKVHSNFWGRLGDTLGGMGRTAAGASANAVAVMHAAGKADLADTNSTTMGSLAATMLPQTTPGQFGMDEDDLKRIDANYQKIKDWGTKVNEKGQTQIDAAKYGLGKVGQTAVDVGVAGGHLAIDTALASIPGIGPALAKASLMSRAYGGAAFEAEAEGASIQEQSDYGMISAVTETAIEMLGGVGSKFAYGQGFTDDITEEVIRRLAKTDAGRTALRTLASYISEYGEEAVMPYLTPFLKLTYDEGESLKHSYGTKEGRNEMFKQSIQDGLIGGILGLAGQGVNMATGADAAANEALRNPKITKPTTAPQSAPATQGDVVTPTSTQEASTSHSQELNSADITEYERRTNDYGYGVRSDRYRNDYDVPVDEVDASFGLAHGFVSLSDAEALAEVLEGGVTEEVAARILNDNRLRRTYSKFSELLPGGSKRNYDKNIKFIIEDSKIGGYGSLLNVIKREIAVKKTENSPKAKLHNYQNDYFAPLPEIGNEDSKAYIEAERERAISENQEKNKPVDRKPAPVAEQVDPKLAAWRTEQDARQAATEERVAKEEAEQRKSLEKERDSKAYWSQVYDEATADYDDAVKLFWEENPDKKKLQSDLKYKKEWIKARANQIHKENQDFRTREDETNFAYGNADIQEAIYDILGNKSTNAQEKIAQIEEVLGSNHGYKVDENGDVVKEYDHKTRDNTEYEDDYKGENEQFYSPTALSNTKVGAKGTKGEYVSESGIKFTNREEPGFVRSAERAERKRKYKEVAAEEAERAKYETIPAPTEQTDEQKQAWFEANKKKRAEQAAKTPQEILIEAGGGSTSTALKTDTKADKVEDKIDPVEVVTGIPAPKKAKPKTDKGAKDTKQVVAKSNPSTQRDADLVDAARKLGWNIPKGAKTNAELAEQLGFDSVEELESELGIAYAENRAYGDDDIPDEYYEELERMERNNGRKADAGLGDNRQAQEGKTPVGDRRGADTGSSQEQAPDVRRGSRGTRKNNGRVLESGSTSDTGGDRVRLVSEEVDLPNGRKGVPAKAEGDGITFAEGSHEITRFNKRDKALIKFAEKHGVKLRLFDGKLYLSGKESAGIHRGDKGDIFVDISKKGAIETVVHEILHEKFKAKSQHGNRYAGSVEAFNTLAALAERNGKKQQFDELYNRAKRVYYDTYMSRAVEAAKAKGKSDRWIKENIQGIEDSVLDHIKEEVVVPIAAGHTGTKSSDLFAMFKDDARKILIGLEVVDKDFFDSIPYTKRPKTSLDNPLTDVVLDRMEAQQEAEDIAPWEGEDRFEQETKPVAQPEQKEAEAAKSEDDDLPFTFGSEEPVQDKAKPIEDVPPAPMYEPVKNEVAEKSKPKPKKETVEERGKKLYGDKYGEVKAVSDRIEHKKMFYSGDKFTKLVGKKAANDVAQKMGELRYTVKEYARGNINEEQLLNYYSKLKGTKGMDFFHSDKVQNMIERTASALVEAQNGTRYEQIRYEWLVANTMNAIEHSFNVADTAMKNMIDFKLAAQKNGPKKKFNGLIGRFASLQIDPVTMFQMVDGFDPDANGFGYATSEAAQDAAAVTSIERVNGNSFFSKFKSDAKEVVDFLSGSSKTGVKLGDTELSQIQAVSVVGMYITMKNDGMQKFEGLKGIRIGTGDKAINVDFNGEGSVAEQFEALYNEVNAALNDTAKQYLATMRKMFAYYRPKLSNTAESINGYKPFMYTKKDKSGQDTYYTLRFHKEGTVEQEFSLEDSLNEPSEPADYDAERKDIGKPGILKTREKYSGEYLILEPASEVAMRYINQASRYIGNAQYAQMLTLMNKSGGFAPSLSDTLSTEYGKAFGEWMNEYVKDMNPALDTKERPEWMQQGNELLKKGRKNLQQGALMLSPTVPAKQGAAYWSAAGILRPSSLIKAYRPFYAGKAAKDNALAADRRLGNIDSDLNELLHGTDTWVNKLKGKDPLFRKFVDSIGKADAKVIDNLMKATIVDVAADFKEQGKTVDKNSAEFKKAVEAKFEQVILNAQSTSSTAISTELQRTDNELLRMISMFRSQQSQEFNKLIRAWGEKNAAKGTDKAAEKNKTFNRTVAGQIASAVHFSVITAIMNLLLHKHDRYEDEDDEIDVGKVLGSIAIDSVESLAGLTLFGDSVAQWLIDTGAKAIGKDSNEFYGIPLGAIDTVIDLVNSIGYFAENKTLVNAKRVAGNIGNVTGIPVNNVYTMLNAVAMWTIDGLGENPDDYDDLLKFIRAETKKETIEHDEVDYELTRKESREYRKTKETTYGEYLDYVLNMDLYKKSDSDTQKKINDRLKEYANDYAKDQYLTSKGIEYESTHDKLTSKIVIPGTYSNNAKKSDIPAMSESDIPKYLAYSAAMNEAKANEDYDAVDILLSSMNKTLPGQLQRRYAKNNTWVSGLKKAYDAGVKSKDYYEVKDSIVERAQKLDLDTGASMAILDGIIHANVSQKTKDTMVEQKIESKQIKAAYAGAKQIPGYDMSKLPALYEETLRIDPEGSDDDFSQKELKAAYKNNPGLEYIFEAIWNTKLKSASNPNGWKKSWDEAVH